MPPHAPRRFAAFAQIGPGPKAVADAADLLDSLSAHEPAATALLVDDEPGRDLAGLLGRRDGVRVIPNPRGGRGDGFYGGMCVGTFAGLAAAGADLIGGDPAAFVVKLDADALVIAPFAERLAELARRRPDAGVIGAYRTTPNGSPRGFEVQADRVRLIGRRRPFSLDRRARVLRRLVGRAVANGYELGEHVLGGAYAVTRAGLDGLAATGAFADPLLWLGARLTEDAAVGLHARAAGLTMLDHVGPGEVFGVRYVGLPFPPAELLARGYAIIHSVKNDPQHPEAEVRDFFRRHRVSLP